MDRFIMANIESRISVFSKEVIYLVSIPGIEGKVVNKYDYKNNTNTWSFKAIYPTSIPKALEESFVAMVKKEYAPC